MLSYDDITPAQDDAITRLVEHDRTLLIAPKGFGKAMVGQTALQELLAENAIRRALVLAPLKVCQLTWATEHEKWSHLALVGVAAGAGEVLRRHVIEGDSEIVVLNFDNLAWFCDVYGEDHGFDALLVDESTKLKSAGGTGFKALRKLLATFDWVCAMTADAVAEMGTDIYGQALLVDGGKALGRNQEVFRRRYFYPLDFGQRRWRILPGMEAELTQALGGILYVAQDAGYEDSLPELREHVIEVDLPDAVRALYDEIEVKGVIAVDSCCGVEIEAPSAGVVAAKRRQMCAGAVYDADGGTHLLHGEKTAEAAAFIASAARPLIVVYAYRFELDWLRGYQDVVVLADNPKAAQDAWNAGEVRLLALHPDSAGHGLNLQYGGHDMLVLTAPWGADPWEQIIGRIRRRGQPSDHVNRTTIVVRDSVDADCMARHLEKRYDSAILNDAFASGGEQ